MLKEKWLNLQLFAGEGAGTGTAGDGGGEGATAGENSVDAGQQRLLELGVPADKIRKRANKSAVSSKGVVQTAQKAEETQQTTEQAADATNPTEETKTDAPARMSWEEIMADPEYNKQMQAVVQSRLRSAKGAEDTLSKIAPALEILAAKYKLNPEKMDYDALAKAISDDNHYYEEKALKMGVSVETAKQLDQEERETVRQKKENERNLEEQKFLQHFQKLEEQGKELQKTFPNFNLQVELKNPVFARMTAPNGGVSVEDAYYAVHRKEIQSAAMQVTAQRTAQNISNAIQAGQRRPVENGTSGQAASVTSFDYRNASPEQRDALKKRIKEAAARGEKLYPGQR